MYIQITATKILFYFIFYIYYIMMKSPTSNNNINAIKETRKLLNDVISNLSHEETKRIRKNSTKKKLPAIFSKKERMMAL